MLSFSLNDWSDIVIVWMYVYRNSRLNLPDNTFNRWLSCDDRVPRRDVTTAAALDEQWQPQRSTTQQHGVRQNVSQVIN